MASRSRVVTPASGSSRDSSGATSFCAPVAALVSRAGADSAPAPDPLVRRPGEVLQGDQVAEAVPVDEQRHIRVALPGQPGKHADALDRGRHAIDVVARARRPAVAGMIGGVDRVAGLREASGHVGRYRPLCSCTPWTSTTTPAGAWTGQPCQYWPEGRVPSGVLRPG